MTTSTTISEPAMIADPMLPRPFRVVTRAMDTDDTVTLGLIPCDAGPTLTFEPGQFTMMYIHGIGEVPISISGNPAEPEVLVHTVRSVGAVTAAIVGLSPGDDVGIRGPYGTSWPVSGMMDRDVVVVAGGIGLAPVRPAIHHLLANRDEFKTVSIVYGSRKPGDILYPDLLGQWKARFDTNVQITVDRGEPGWSGDVGVVTPLLNRLAFDPENTSAIVCGPEIMMRVVAGDLIRRGVNADDIYVSLERNMKCAIGFCGHCQFGSTFVCKDGPVVPYAAVSDRLGVEEL